MISVQIDQEQLKELYMNEVKRRLDQIEQDVTFWDAKELRRQTNMSWNTIQEKFFHDPDFPKFSTGNKWYFPAKECREFLINWAKENQYESKINFTERDVS